MYSFCGGEWRWNEEIQPNKISQIRLNGISRSLINLIYWTKNIEPFSTNFLRFPQTSFPQKTHQFHFLNICGIQLFFSFVPSVTWGGWLGILWSLQWSQRKLKVVVVLWLTHVRLLLTPWTVAHRAPLSTGCSRQDPGHGLPHPPPVPYRDPKQFP